VRPKWEERGGGKKIACSPCPISRGEEGVAFFLAVCRKGERRGGKGGKRGKANLLLWCWWTGVVRISTKEKEIFVGASKKKRGKGAAPTHWWPNFGLRYAKSMGGKGKKKPFSSNTKKGGKGVKRCILRTRKRKKGKWENILEKKKRSSCEPRRS